MKKLFTVALTLLSISAFASDSLSNLAAGSTLTVAKDIVIPAGEYHYSLSENCYLNMTATAASERVIPAGTVLTVKAAESKAFRQQNTHNNIFVDAIDVNVIGCISKYRSDMTVLEFTKAVKNVLELQIAE